MTQIIAFAGRKQSGKTTCSEFVQKYANGLIEPYNSVKIYNFADPLKLDICINILGLTTDQCYGTDDQKNELVDCYWDNKQLTAREVMQMVGTDMFRAMQKNVWSAATIRKINNEKPSVAIIADCRFPNEVEAIKDAGGMVIKLNRNPYNSSHSSEIALDADRYDQTLFDLVIYNQNMTIVEQNQYLEKFLQNKGILPL
jgi:hypothetical protein